MLAPFLTEDCDNEVGCPVCDLRLIVEVGHRIDHAKELRDTLYALKAADRVLDGCEHVQHHELGGLLAFLDTEVATELAQVLRLAVLERAVSRYKRCAADEKAPT